jgi:endogenous inhibitor of DNA gyrase (YacG/DUF329 family)
MICPECKKEMIQKNEFDYFCGDIKCKLYEIVYTLEPKKG